MGDRSRGRFATPADFPRHDGTRTEGYAYAAKVWELSIVQGPLSVAPCQTLALRFATVSSPLYVARIVRPCLLQAPSSSPTSVSHSHRLSSLTHSLVSFPSRLRSSCGGCTTPSTASLPPPHRGVMRAEAPHPPAAPSTSYPHRGEWSSRRAPHTSWVARLAPTLGRESPRPSLLAGGRKPRGRRRRRRRLRGRRRRRTCRRRSSQRGGCPLSPPSGPLRTTQPSPRFVLALRSVSWALVGTSNAQRLWAGTACTTEVHYQLCSATFSSPFFRSVVDELTRSFVPPTSPSSPSGSICLRAQRASAGGGYDAGGFSARGRGRGSSGRARRRQAVGQALPKPVKGFKGFQGRFEFGTINIGLVYREIEPVRFMSSAIVLYP